MAEIKLQNLSKTYDNGTKALQSVDLTIGDQDFVVLLGPSGCGKSTMLRLIAGLEMPTEGEIFFDGENMNKVETMKRKVSMVFQSFALYPHLNVYKNIAFPLKSMKLPMEEIKRRVEETAAILDITHLLNRKPKVLSGGQRQRVALARAMVREPVVFLLDEPLSNLDAKMRIDLRDEIIALHKRLQTTFLYVTHDQAEAMHMASKLVVMHEGKIIQTGTPQHLYNYPQTVFVAGFIGTPKMNFFASRLLKQENAWAVSVLGKTMQIPAQRIPADQSDLAEGQKVIVGIQPEEFRYCQEAPQLTATACRIVPMGAGLHVEAEHAGKRFLTVLQNHTNLNPGDSMPLSVDPWCIQVFDAATEENLCKSVYKGEA